MFCWWSQMNPTFICTEWLERQHGKSSHVILLYKNSNKIPKIPSSAFSNDFSKCLDKKRGYKLENYHMLFNHFETCKFFRKIQVLLFVRYLVWVLHSAGIIWEVTQNSIGNVFIKFRTEFHIFNLSHQKYISRGKRSIKLYTTRYCLL